MPALLLSHGADEHLDGEFVQAFAAQEAMVLRPARAADRAQVGDAEARVSSAPKTASSFDASGSATLRVGGQRNSRHLTRSPFAVRQSESN